MATSTIKKEFTDIVFLTRIEKTFTTGTTGNIHTGYSNDGKQLIFGAHATGLNVRFDIWVSGTNGAWYLKARDADTGNVVPNTEIAVRFYVLRIP